MANLIAMMAISCWSVMSVAGQPIQLDRGHRCRRRLELERVSVGEHILLGGDNMDLALAYALNAKLEAAGKRLDSWQFLALVHAASKAKIVLFDDGGLAQAPIAVPSRGSSLLAKTVSTTLDREMLEQVVVDGFSPEQR